ncbi:MAG: S41 family peptidase [Pirellulaceae bacterium]|jgi:carboxyl-terminal processing protease|nr:S41 family peptidase [Pirellulaceae bacterium]
MRHYNYLSFRRFLTGSAIVGCTFLAAPVQAQVPSPRPPDNASDRPAEKRADKPPTASRADDEEFYKLLELFVDTLDQVDRNYVKEIGRRELLEAAIEGMLSKLDQHSSYIAPSELEEFRRELDGEFGGLGVRVSVVDGNAIIAAPLFGGPAYRGGLVAGDRIEKIDGQLAEGFSNVDQVAERLRGKLGETVKLDIVKASGERKSVELKREVVKLPSVLGDRRKDDDTWDFMFDHDAKIGYVRIDHFGRRTAKEMQDALEELSKQEARGLIVDLRFNPGGLLSAAVQVSDMFIAEGEIVSVRGRNYPNRTWRAHKHNTIAKMPTAVLVNHYSASASEVVAACLQDHDRATVVGERTWGKGSVQNVIEFESGKSAVKLTTAGYHRPSGANIHRGKETPDSAVWGVTPDEGLAVGLNAAQFGRMVTMRRANDLLRRDEDGKLIHTRHVDPQLARALEDVRRQMQKAAATPADNPSNKE